MEKKLIVNPFHKFQELIKTSVRENGNITPFLIDQVIRQQENLHAERLRDHVFDRVISDHQAFLRREPGSFGDSAKIIGVGLAEPARFHSGKEFEIGGFKAGPTDSAFGRDRGKNRVRRQDRSEAELFNFFKKTGVAAWRESGKLFAII